MGLEDPAPLLDLPLLPLMLADVPQQSLGHFDLVATFLLLRGGSI